MTVVKCWVVQLNYMDTVHLHFEDSKEDAVKYARHLDSRVRKHVAVIYEGFAGLNRWGYEEIHSKIPMLDSSSGLPDGERISGEELDSILWD